MATMFGSFEIAVPCPICAVQLGTTLRATEQQREDDELIVTLVASDCGDLIREHLATHSRGELEDFGAVSV